MTLQMQSVTWGFHIRLRYLGDSYYSTCHCIFVSFPQFFLQVSCTAEEELVWEVHCLDICKVLFQVLV